MKEIGEKETDKLEKEGDEGVEAEDEERSSGKVVDYHVSTRVDARWCMYSGFPIRWYCIRLCLCIRLGRTPDLIGFNSQHGLSKRGNSREVLPFEFPLA